MVRIPLRTAPGQLAINVDLDIVSKDNTVLGLDRFDIELLTPCTIMNRLIECITYEDNTLGYTDLFHVPLDRTISLHIYAEMEYQTPNCDNKVKIQRLHLHLSHPSSQKLFNVISKARLCDATPETNFC